jgi:sigma-B regulation protein RsbU (phosphoserine phosphatase)
MAADLHNRLELALLASNEGVWDWYVGEEDIYYSDRVLDFLGYSADKAPNIILQARKYFHPEELPKLRDTFKKIVKKDGDQTLAHDCRYLHPDGSWRWLRIRGVVVRDNNGTAYRIVGSIIDISKRKNAEMALEEERHRLRELIENIPINVYYKDTESRFVLANSSTAEKLGAKSERDLLGKTDYDFFDKRHADMGRADELEIMKTRVPMLKALQRETYEDGKITWAETSKLPWLDRKGELCGTFGITTDITALFNAQHELGALADELQKRNVAIEEELQLAREIQQALLPKELDGLILQDSDREVTVGCRYCPASEMAGDFFEVIPISQHCMGILLCDVMGHGVRASLVVSMLRGLMEKERESATSPEWFLYGVNDGLVSIFERAGVTLFATAIYLIIDLKKGVLQYACAGHPTPVVIRLGKGKLLEPEGVKPNPALGLIPQAVFTTHTVSLDEIDRLLVYTDGLHEVEDAAGDQLGIERVITKMEESIEEDLETSLDTLLDYARRHSDEGEFGDDVCLFGMEVGSGL